MCNLMMIKQRSFSWQCEKRVNYLFIASNLTLSFLLHKQKVNKVNCILSLTYAVIGSMTDERNAFLKCQILRGIKYVARFFLSRFLPKIQSCGYIVISLISIFSKGNGIIIDCKSWTTLIRELKIIHSRCVTLL